MRSLSCTLCSFYSASLSKKQHVSLYDFDIATDDEAEEVQPPAKKKKVKVKENKSRSEQESCS